MDTILGIPHGELTVVGFETGSTVILLAQPCCDFANGFLFLKFRYDCHPGIFRIASKTEHMVDILLGKRKSEGCRSYTLRFVNLVYLLLFCGEYRQIKER